MDFSEKLNASDAARVRDADELLANPARLEELARTGLMSSPSDEALDRLAKLAAKVLKVPLTLVSLVSDKRQLFKGSFGLPPPYDVTREIPIDGSICRYTLKGEPIIVADATVDPLLRNHPSTKPWNIVGFIALPMIMPSGHVLGAFCAVDRVKRVWSEEDVQILRELTASVMTEISLRVQVLKYEIERRLRERFVAMLTHDLRNPLTAAKIGAQLLMRTQQDDSVKLALGRVARSIDRADHMIHDVLDASRVNAGEKVRIERQNCDLNGLFSECLDDLIMVHGKRFVFEAPKDLKGQWDARALRRVLENLVSNSVKYGDGSKPITITVKQKNQMTMIAVHNWGVPIPELDQELLFEPYHRSESALMSHQAGWGIGLTLVKGLAEAHGGSVQVQSSQERGTTFTVNLPTA